MSAQKPTGHPQLLKYAIVQANMISLSIRTKLFLAIFLACTLAVSFSAALFHYRIQKAFTEYLQALDTAFIDNSARTLENHYAQHQSWDHLKDRRQWRRILQISRRQTSRESLPTPREARIKLERNPSRHRIGFRTVLYDKDKNHIQGRAHKNLPVLLKKLELDDEVIGYLGMYQRREFNDDSEDSRFINEQNKTLGLVALLTFLTSLAIAFLLSRKLVQPIQILRHNTSELAKGNYTSRINVQSNDELGLLGRDFNQLAKSLEQHETSRKQWIMDIAHELRTPISILRGEIEAIQDGISKPDPQTVQSLHQETLHLQRLVEDLYTLSMSDSGSLTYHKTKLDLAEALKETLSQFEQQIDEHNLTLSTVIPDHPIYFYGDAQRLQQLFQNLIKNSLRYTDQPGKLAIQLKANKQSITINFSDSAPSVPDNALPKIFQRLYRVESSRNRATGGAGIGLSICHNIVQAHDGTITADHSTLGGLSVIVSLPQSS